MELEYSEHPRFAGVTQVTFSHPIVAIVPYEVDTEEKHDSSVGMVFICIIFVFHSFTTIARLSFVNISAGPLSIVDLLPLHVEVYAIP